MKPKTFSKKWDYEEGLNELRIPVKNEVYRKWWFWIIIMILVFLLFKLFR